MCPCDVANPFYTFHSIYITHITFTPFDGQYFLQYRPSNGVKSHNNLVPGDFGLTSLGWNNVVSKFTRKRCRIISKKAYACWLNFVEKFFTSHVKPSKLLEKSKSRMCLLTLFSLSTGEDGVSFKKKISVLELQFFFGFWPNFLGL
jgi:hypothetical protein